MTASTIQNVKLESAYNVTLFYKNLERRKYLVALQKFVKNRLASFHCELNRLTDATGEVGGEKTGELVSLFRHELLQMKILHDEISQPFSIFIMGIGKHGKSTVINALIGAKKAEIDFLPKTWKIDVFQYFSHIDKANICFENGSSMWMPEVEALSFLKEEEAKRGESEKIVTEELKKQQDSIKYDKEALDKLKAELQNKYLYKSPVVNVVWPCYRSRILSHFKLVDTPGVKQELLSKDITERVEDYYNKADGALWILDATVLTKEGSMRALEEMDINELNNDSKNVILVLNKIDKIRHSDSYSDEIIIGEANKIYKTRVSSIALLSAKEALEGVLSKNDNLIEQSGYNNLVELIENTFLKNAATIKFHRKFKGYKGYISNLSTVTSDYLMSLEQDVILYDRLKSRFDKDIESRCNVLVDKIDLLVKEYKEGVVSRINSNVDRIFEFNDKDENIRTENLNKFISGVIFDERALDSMVRKIQHCVSDEFDNISHYWREKSVFKRYEFVKERHALSKALIDSVNVPHTKISINADMGASIGLGALGGGLAASLLGGPIGWVVGVAIFLFTRGYQREERRQKAISRLNESLSKLLDDISEKTELEINQQAQTIKSTINQIREKSFCRMYFNIEKAGEIKGILHDILAELNSENKIPRASLYNFFEGGDYGHQI